MSLGDLERVASDSVVYIVDDNAHNRELVGAYLEDIGCRVESFESGRAALDAIGSLAPDLVLLDIMMPVMSGFQVCELIKGQAATAQVPILMLTALNESADVERAMEAGADDFLIKPVQRQELLARVRAQLKVAELRREMDRVIGGLRSLAPA